MNTPTPVSTKFRRTLLGCFALQRLIVTIGVALSTLFIPAHLASDLDSLGLLLGDVAVLLVLLGCTFLARGASVVKWFFLLLLSLAEVAIWIGFDTLLHTNIRLFNCSFTVVWVLILMLFDAIRGRKRTKVHDAIMIKLGDSTEAGWVDPHHKEKASDTCLQAYFDGSSDFLAIHKDGPVSFIITTTVSSVVYGVYMSKFLSWMDFGLSLLFQFVLLSWYTLDLRRLDRHLDINEASLGVMYVYVDVVLVLGYTTMILAVIGIVAALCVGFMMSGPIVCSGSGGCSGWGNCCERNRCSDRCYRQCYSWTCCGYYWFCDDGLSCDDSKCLFYSKHHSECDCCASFPSEKRGIPREQRGQQQGLEEVMQRV